MKLSMICMAVALTVLVLTNGEFANSKHVQQPGQNASSSLYQQVLDKIFPRNAGDFSQKGTGLKEFSLSLRFKPTTEPESQLTIDRYNNGMTEVVYYQVGNKKNVAVQLARIIDETGKRDVEFLAKSIPVEIRTILKPAPRIERILAKYANLRLPLQLNTDIFLDGTRYELWYEAISNKVHLTLSGGQDKKSQEDMIINWMKEALQTVQQLAT
jgi:hypothetical protein